MIEVTTRTKEWGNSVGVILPKKMGFLPDQEVHIHIELLKKFTRVKDIFGKIKLKRNVAVLMKELDEELDVGV